MRISDNHHPAGLIVNLLRMLPSLDQHSPACSRCWGNSGTAPSGSPRTATTVAQLAQASTVLCMCRSTRLIERDARARVAAGALYVEQREPVGAALVERREERVAEQLRADAEERDPDDYVSPVSTRKCAKTATRAHWPSMVRYCADQPTMHCEQGGRTVTSWQMEITLVSSPDPCAANQQCCTSTQ